jgi:hypothetical protein
MTLPVLLVVLLALLAVAALVAVTASVVRGDGYRAAPCRPGGGGTAWSAGDLPSVGYRER